MRCTAITGTETLVHKGGGGAHRNGQTPSILPGWASLMDVEQRTTFVPCPLNEQVLFLLFLLFLGLLLGSVEEYCGDAGSQSGDERQDESS